MYNVPEVNKTKNKGGRSKEHIYSYLFFFFLVEGGTYSYLKQSIYQGMHLIIRANLCNTEILPSANFGSHSARRKWFELLTAFYYKETVFL